MGPPFKSTKKRTKRRSKVAGVFMQDKLRSNIELDSWQKRDGQIYAGHTMAYNGPLRRGALRLAASTSPFPAAAAADPQFHAIHSYFHTRALLSLRHGSPAQQRTRTSFHQARGFSSDVGTNSPSSGPPSDGTPPNTVTPPPPPPLPHAKHPGHAQDYIPLIRRLLPHLPTPHNPLHRPTKEELLAAATSVWQRLRIRFKWFSIRGWRRFNADDLSAFLSWFLVGNSELSSARWSMWNAR